ncbi:MAG TPA: group 1 truncated hemoglobin [Dyella sp.]|nr:group 1 truncated hemoglobin [Dyella sp.]
MRLRFVLVIALLVAGCARMPDKAPTLYDQLGGQAGVAAITESLLDAMANDPLVAPSFAHVDITRWKRVFADYVCQTSDGPCRYTGGSMEDVHRGMDINEAMFNALVEDLITAMNRQHVPVRVQNRLIARLAPTRPQMLYR